MEIPYIKYDDDNFGLILELKLPGAGSYLKIGPDLAKTLIAEGERAEIDRFRGDLLARPQANQSARSTGLIASLFSLIPATNPNLIPIDPQSYPRRSSNNNIERSLQRMSGGTAATTSDPLEAWAPNPEASQASDAL